MRFVEMKPKQPNWSSYGAESSRQIGKGEEEQMDAGLAPRPLLGCVDVAATAAVFAAAAVSRA